MSDPDDALLRSILEELPTGVWVARVPSGELAYANETFAQIMGMPARGGERAGEHVANYRLLDRAGRPFPEERLPYCCALRERRTVVVDDMLVERPDGSRVNVRAVGKPLFDSEGEIRHVVVAFHDITREVLAHVESTKTREQLRIAVEHAPIALFANDLEGIITVSQGAALPALGFRSGELLGRSVYDLYRHVPEVLNNTRRALSGETFNTTTEVGDTVMETWMGPLRDEAGEIRGVIGVATDVTERLRLRRQMATAERLAALGRLAASVAHEINNPLSYALEALRLAQEQLANNPAAVNGGGEKQALLARLLADAADGMNRVHVITRDLKTSARGEDVRTRVEVATVVDAALKLVARVAAGCAEIQVERDPQAVVRADENRLVQVLVNLIDNALDALPPDRAHQNLIRVTVRVEAQWACIEVADNGVGLPAAVRDHIFEPFFTTKPVGKGTGLGLFVTRNIVQTYGGRLEVEDAPGGGSLFRVMLPLDITSVDNSQSPPLTPVEEPVAGRVLIIDDEPYLAALFRLSLRGEYEVQAFTSGRAALEHVLAAPPYDLILCDLMMSDVSGMNFYQELQRQAPGRERELVFMTGGVFDPEIGQFLESIPNDCVDKPFDVRAEVRRRLGRPQAGSR